MIEKEIQNVLYNYCSQKHHDYMIPNYHISYEADFVSVTKSGYINEYEIKCTRADFKAEFKHKIRKHKYLKKKEQFCPGPEQSLRRNGPGQLAGFLSQQAAP